jgi:hypothetical protein
MHRSWAKPAAAAALVLGMTLAGVPSPAGADDPDGGMGDRAGAQNDGTSVTGTAQTGGPGSTPPPAGADDGSNGPNCVRSDGTPDYLVYEDLMVTTQDEQRNDIRKDETPDEPGVWLHVSCGPEYVGMRFFPDGPTGPTVNPCVLARSVRITPPAPEIHTSPDMGDHLVGMTAWFWVDSWEAITASRSAGGVTVTVTAQPATLTIDPGDGTGTFTCVNPPAYSPGATSSCTHEYQRAGSVTATATLTYDTSFTSNVGAGGALGTIQPRATAQLTVSEAQAINTRG